MIFGSDNLAGASPEVLAAVAAAFSGHGGSYGADDDCRAAEAALREVFETDLKAYFVATGTAANCLALSAALKPWGAAVCHHHAHILNDENTAPGFFADGARLLAATPFAPKLSAPALERQLAGAADDAPHAALPQALSISQANETGQVYSAEDIAALADVAHGHGLRVHMDGARFANAVAHLGAAPADVSWRAGVDMLSLGATKNGAIAAEAVIFFDDGLAEDFVYRVKRSGQLLSKGRFYGVQFQAWLQDGHWLDLARHANAMAAELAEILAATPGVDLAFPAQTNELFAEMPAATADQLRAAGVVCYDWPTEALLPETPSAGRKLVRFVTSFMTTEAELAEFRALCQTL